MLDPSFYVARVVSRLKYQRPPYWYNNNNNNNNFFLGLPSLLRFSSTIQVFVFTYNLTHAVGLLWTTDRPVEEASTYTGQYKIKHKRQTYMPRAGFELATPATKRLQTYALDCAATEIGNNNDNNNNNNNNNNMKMKFGWEKCARICLK
jgi:hypothetical protein